MQEATLFDPRRVPLSRRESWLCLSWIAEDGAFWLRNLRGGDERTDLGRLFRIDLQGGDDARWTLAPGALRVEAGGGWLEFAFADTDTLAIAGQGLTLQLSLQSRHYDYAQRLDGDAAHVSCARQDLSARIAVRAGTLALDAPWQGQRAERIELALQPGSEGLVASIHLYRVRPARLDVADAAAARAQAQADFDAWLALTPPAPPELAELRRLAAYICWSCLVPAEGQLPYAAMYMSKNWMTNIWSWDHGFNALALGQLQPQRAWEQFALPFTHQHASGRLPDFVNDLFAYWRFTKPPIHGWVLGQLRRMAPEFWTAERLTQAHGWLAAQAGSWLATAEPGGLPRYDHGNDAGWDNATVFLRGTPLASPDLATLLVLQLDELAEVASLLGRPAEGWRGQADALATRLIEQLWTGERFIARDAQGHAVEAGDSLITFMPLLLGERLPAPIRERLLAGLTAPGRFWTEHGLATEAITSPHYRDDVYWRGPIWAPTTLLFHSALLRCGRPELAGQLARGYTAMCARAGLAENFDARSGAPLRDSAFTWTSSVALLLAQSLLENGA